MLHQQLRQFDKGTFFDNPLAGPVGKPNPVAASKLLRTCVTDEKVFWSQHAVEKIHAGLGRSIDINVLHGGTLEAPAGKSGA